MLRKSYLAGVSVCHRLSWYDCRVGEAVVTPDV
jgi:hypothetical protein